MTKTFWILFIFLLVDLCYTLEIHSDKRSHVRNCDWDNLGSAKDCDSSEDSGEEDDNEDTDTDMSHSPSGYFLLLGVFGAILLGFMACSAIFIYWKRRLNMKGNRIQVASAPNPNLPIFSPVVYTIPGQVENPNGRPSLTSSRAQQEVKIHASSNESYVPPPYYTVVSSNEKREASGEMEIEKPPPYNPATMSL